MQTKNAPRATRLTDVRWWQSSSLTGFGLAEIVGGFLAKGQALKADALDFLGDGSITLLGVLALGWAKQTRARVALTQGWFLALLGIGVMAMAGWRAMNAILPEADLMGGIGVAALGVNIISALALSPFRGLGGANARAIWLFSRNDALANIAVIIAAGLVAWFNSGWPDLVVATLIAILFLHSAWKIVCDARDGIRGKRQASSEVRTL